MMLHERCRYLLRSQHEWTDRGRFHRIYPRPPRGHAPGVDEVERLLGYIGLLHPEFASKRNAAVASRSTAAASAQAGAALEETSWMVRELNLLHYSGLYRLSRHRAHEVWLSVW